MVNICFILGVFTSYSLLTPPVHPKVFASSEKLEDSRSLLFVVAVEEGGSRVVSVVANEKQPLDPSFLSFDLGDQRNDFLARRVHVEDVAEKVANHNASPIGCVIRLALKVQLVLFDLSELLLVFLKVIFLKVIFLKVIFLNVLEGNFQNFFLLLLLHDLNERSDRKIAPTFYLLFLSGDKKFLFCAANVDIELLQLFSDKHLNGSLNGNQLLRIALSEKKLKVGRVGKSLHVSSFEFSNRRPSEKFRV